MATISQLPGSAPIEIVQGNDFEILATWTDDEGDPLDLSGYTFAAGIDLACGETIEIGVEAVNLVQGQIAISLARADTATIPLGTHHWWFDWITDGDYRETMLSGAVTVSKR